MGVSGCVCDRAFRSCLQHEFGQEQTRSLSGSTVDDKIDEYSGSNVIRDSLISGGKHLSVKLSTTARMNSLNQSTALVLLLIVGQANAGDWPMYRRDAGRTAVCRSEMPSNLTLRWARQLPPLTPAFHNPRLQFDAGYEPVSSGGMLLVASSQTDSVIAYDIDTGDLRWTFRTNGPVRCAPAIWRDRVCFGSDDGYLYCVELKTGKLCWKHRAAPSDRRLLGNGRLISVWPVRGGPVVADGHVYFAAGVWPFEGVFVYAMDIATGKVVWRNDRMGYLFGQHPHNTEAIGGLAPQGYLLINDSELIVPCSTAFPARLNRHDGSLIEFQLPGPGRLPGGVVFPGRYRYRSGNTPKRHHLRRCYQSPGARGQRTQSGRWCLRAESTDSHR